METGYAVQIKKPGQRNWIDLHSPVSHETAKEESAALQPRPGTQIRVKKIF